MTTNNQLIINLSKQMYLAASTGQSYQVALDLVAKNTKDRQIKALLVKINATLDHADLLTALKNAGIFDDYYLQMVQAGLYSGNVDDIFLHLANYYQLQEDNRQKLAQLVNYPLAMCLFLMAILMILTTWIFPVFNDLYASMGMNLTGLALFCLQLGRFINDYFVAIIIVGATCAAVFLILVKSDKIKIFKKVATLTKTTNDLFAMSSLIKAGLPFETTTNLVFASPKGLVEAFQEKLEPLELALLELSVSNGTYDKVLAMLHDDYRSKTQAKTSRTMEQFELYFTGGFVMVVAIILLSLILPLFVILGQL